MEKHRRSDVKHQQNKSHRKHTHSNHNEAKRQKLMKDVCGKISNKNIDRKVRSDQVQKRAAKDKNSTKHSWGEKEKQIKNGAKSKCLCAGCTAPNCATCVFCQDMVVNGGENRRKQRCIERACLLNSRPRKNSCCVQKEKLKSSSAHKRDHGKSSAHKTSRGKRPRCQSGLSHKPNKAPLSTDGKRPKNSTRNSYVNCGACKNCRRKDDCGACKFCLDKRKLGGANKHRKMCIKKYCRSAPPPNYHRVKMSDSETNSSVSKGSRLTSNSHPSSNPHLHPDKKEALSEVEMADNESLTKEVKSEEERQSKEVKVEEEGASDEDRVIEDKDEELMSEEEIQSEDGWTEEEEGSEGGWTEEEGSEEEVMSAFSVRLVQEAQRVLGCIEHWDANGKPSEMPKLEMMLSPPLLSRNNSPPSLRQMRTDDRLSPPPPASRANNQSPNQKSDSRKASVSPECCLSPPKLTAESSLRHRSKPIASLSCSPADLETRSNCGDNIVCDRNRKTSTSRDINITSVNENVNLNCTAVKKRVIEKLSESRTEATSNTENDKSNQVSDENVDHQSTKVDVVTEDQTSGYSSADTNKETPRDSRRTSRQTSLSDHVAADSSLPKTDIQHLPNTSTSAFYDLKAASTAMADTSRVPHREPLLSTLYGEFENVKTSQCSENYQSVSPPPQHVHDSATSQSNARSPNVSHIEDKGAVLTASKVGSQPQASDRAKTSHPYNNPNENASRVIALTNSNQVHLLPQKTGNALLENTGANILPTAERDGLCGILSEDRVQVSDLEHWFSSL